MTTERQLIEQLLKLQEHPEQLTEQQLQDALNDKDMRELVEQLAFTKRALKYDELQTQDPDVEMEWNKFVQRHLERKPLHGSHIGIWGWMHKKVATIAGILLVAGISLAAIRYIGTHTTLGERVGSALKEKVSHDNQASQDSQSVQIADKAEPVVFENVTFEKIIIQIAAFYQVELEFKSDEAKDLRFYFMWNRGEDLDAVIEKLDRFESLNISRVGDRIIVE